jgi:hypothetical protein
MWKKMPAFALCSGVMVAKLRASAYMDKTPVLMHGPGALSAQAQRREPLEQKRHQP